MSSFFTLELDTTGPEISIIAPQYTIPNVETEILIESNEPIAEYQDIYIIDSKGKRHDVIFAKVSPQQYLGKLYFNDYSIGIAQIWGQLKDEVFNLSNKVSRGIEVRPGMKFMVITEHRSRGMIFGDVIRDIASTHSAREMNLVIRNRSVSTNERTRVIKVVVE